MESSLKKCAFHELVKFKLLKGMNFSSDYCFKHFVQIDNDSNLKKAYE